MTTLLSPFRGQNLTARVMRGSSWLMLGYGSSQALRLAANLILARLLFPEAFGLMALVSIVTVGLAMFSDVGIGPAIAQNRRGDDPDFLNTAWTLQLIRGFVLWGIACLLAAPMAQFYGEPDLALYLPVAGTALAIAGFNPTRIETANRHLLVGRLTLLDLAAQGLGVVSMLLLAWATGSVAALVAGAVIGALAKLALTHFGLPGPHNRLRLEPAALRSLMGFGKWIFLSTALWFVASQGDKAILGRALSLESLGIYNIGFFLASFPLLLGHAVTGRILIPVYRDRPPGASPDNARRVRQLRYALSFGVLGMLLAMALAGPQLVGLLYDDRYGGAGGVLVMVAVALMPQVVGLSYDQAALAAGDSRRFFAFSLLRAVALTTCLLAGLGLAGLVGALAGMGLAAIITHGALIWIARTHRLWDPLHDILVGGAGLAGGGLALWLHAGDIAALAHLV